MKTKAAVYVEFGKPMVIDDVDLPDPTALSNGQIAGRAIIEYPGAK